MKNWLYMIYIGLTGYFVSSCQQALDEVMQESFIGKAQISFTIALDDIDSRALQAGWGENEDAEDAEIGIDSENQIDLTSENGLRVLVYNTNGDYLGEVTNKEIRKVSTNIYKFNGHFVANNLSSESLACRLVVYANCEQNLNTFYQTTNFIPMWGVKETMLHLAKGELTQISEPIYLLRAMAKIEVKLDTLMAEKFDLTNVMVDKYNTMGNVKPTGDLFAAVTEGMNQSLVFNPYDESLVTTGLNFTMVEDKSYVYLPEYDNSLNPAEITVVINGKNYTIYFKNYV